MTGVLAATVVPVEAPALAPALDRVANAAPALGGVAAGGVVGAGVANGTATATGGGATDTDGTRVLLTGGAVLAMVVVALAVRYAARAARSRYDEERVATLEAALVTGLIVATAGVVLVIWGDVAELQRALEQFEPDPLFGVRVVVSLLLVAAAYGSTRVAARLIKRREEGDDRRPSVDHRREVAFYLTEVGVYLFVALAVLALWRVNLGNLLVGAGFLGIVLGLAARQTLGAVIAGFVLLFARPFEVGDWVVIGDREGVVTDINVVNTRIRTFDDEQVMIPNDRVTSRDVVNRSREGRLRVTQEVGVDYDTDVGRAVEVAQEAIEDCEAGPVMSLPSPRVVAKRFGDSAVVLELRFWIDDPTARRMWRTRTAVTDAVKDAFEREGIAVPFPQRTLSGREDGPPIETASPDVPPGGPGDGDGGSGGDAASERATGEGSDDEAVADEGSDDDEATTGGEATDGGSASGGRPTGEED